jgi:hypothetical protein
MCTCVLVYMCTLSFVVTCMLYLLICLFACLLACVVLCCASGFARAHDVLVDIPQRCLADGPR